MITKPFAFLAILFGVTAFVLIGLATGGVFAATPRLLAATNADVNNYDCTAVAEIPTTECAALVDLYYSTNGDSWTNYTDWLGTTTPCSWFGLTCAGGHVTQIRLASNGLSGIMPTMLDSLTQLTWLEMQYNAITGGIPPGLGSLSQLTELAIYGNQLSGPIPPQLGNLSQLNALRLAFNQLSGTIPVELANAASLTIIGLADNKLTGDIPPELGNLTGLTLLALDKNQLTGKVPTTFGNFPNMWRLWLENNQLTGPLPIELGNLTALKQFSLRNNHIGGEIPASLTNLTLLQPNYTDFGYNKLTASDPALLTFLSNKDSNWATTQTVAPTNIAAAAQGGNSVQVSWTPIAYTADGGYYAVYYATTPGGPYTKHGVTADKNSTNYLVTGLAANTQYYFSVSSYTPAHGEQQNELSSLYGAEATATTGGFSCASVAQIPQAECDALVALYTSAGGANWTAKSGWLSTTTPCSWSGLTCVAGHVSTLDLKQNGLSGTLPATLKDLVSLSILNLRNNQLSGSIPAQLGSLANLTDLNLSYNQLSGNIPAELASLGKLIKLSLHANQLTGSIPAALGNMPKLEGLILNDNQLSGAIPPQLGNLTQLTRLWLPRNQLSGSIPVELANLVNLRGLAISQNQLTGIIPKQLGNLTLLTDFYLNHNRLEGTIPSELGNLTQVQNFFLLNCQLSGEIPASLANFTHIVDMSVNYNKLTASNPGVIALLNAKNAPWATTQTLPPSNLQAAPQLSSVQLSWTPIAFTGYSGYYQVYYATVAGGPYTLHGVTANKSSNSYTVTGLNPASKYYFVVRTYTPAHPSPADPPNDQQNELYSDYTAEVNATTPADNGGTPPTITSAPVTTALRGQNYHYSVVATGSAPLTYALTSAPSGMTINQATGLIDWTPTTTGSFNVLVKASNNVNSNQQSFTVIVNATPSITSLSPTVGFVGQPYGYDVDATGAPPPTFALLLAPNGMTINAVSGLIAWTPTVTGSYSVTVQANNNVGNQAQSFVINVATINTQVKPHITSAPLTAATAGQPYSYDVEATGTPAPQFSLTVAPPGMSINATTGMLAWTPTAGGDVAVTVQAKNGAGTDSQSFTIQVAAQPDGDSYEDDDSCGQATAIAPTGVNQSHTFHEQGDADWVKFTALAGKTYIIELHNQGAQADAVVLLYDACAQSPAANGSNSFGSTVRLEWDAVKNGDYYLKLQQFDPSFFGNATTYDIAVTVDNTPPSTPKDPRCTAVSASTLGVQWKKNPERDVRGYQISFRKEDNSDSGLFDVSGAESSYYESNALTANQLYYLRVRAVDLSGNESTPTGEFPCRVVPPADTTQPVLTLAQPTAATIYSTTAAALSFSGQAQDPGGNLSRVLVRNTSKNVEAWDYSLTGATDEYRVENLALAAGDNNVQLTVFDEVGNSSQKPFVVRRLGQVAGAVIIVAGHNETFGLQQNIYNSANRAYRIFKSGGFTDDDIYYLAPVDQKPEGDVNRVDATISPAAVQSAITTWAKTHVGAGKPLFIYMVDHGFAEKFCAAGCDATGQVTPADLDGWLRNLESNSGVDQVNIVIEACQSGSFLDRFNGDVANSLSKAGRVVITSTGRDNNAYASAQGAYFSDAFFSCAADSGTLKGCFDEAKAAVSTAQVNQTPWLDDNGDGIYNASDGTVAQQRAVTHFFGSTRPQITTVKVEKAGANGTLSATVDEGAEAVELVWAAIYPPGFQEPSGVTLNLNVPTVRLEADPSQAGRYFFDYANGFSAAGDYRIVFYAQDKLGINAQPRREGDPPVSSGNNLYLPLVAR